MQTNSLRSSRDRFVELDRRFVALEGDQPEITPAYLASKQLGSDMTWNDLLASKLVVLIAEAGSGKSREMKEQVERLQAGGTPAFKLDLKSLVDRPIQFSFSARERLLYQRWRRRGNGYFFLDSIDEAKLARPADFYLALKRFANEIALAHLRAFVVVSTRPNAWQPIQDKAEVLRALSPVESTDQVITSQEVAAFTTQAGAAAKSPDIVIVRMQPLDRERVIKFAEPQVGAIDAGRFAAALDAAHAWDFARRPYDVQQLLSFWKREGRLGTLTQLIQFVVAEGLEEHESGRSQELSIVRAREGARWLAAQTRFARREDIASSDQDWSTIALPAELTARNCLPADWNPGERDALLARPVFEPAAYGFVRFHHRRTAEYLASEWIGDWLARGATTEALRDLLFAKVFGKWHARASIAPLTAWLAGSKGAWTTTIQEWIVAYAPAMHLLYGDPAALPIAYRRRLLQQLVEHYKGRTFVGLIWEAEALARLGTHELAPDISQWIADPGVSEGLRCDYLMLVSHARLEQCAPSILRVFQDDTSSATLRTYALATLREVASASERSDLAATVEQWSEIPANLTGHLTETLYPSVWSEAQLIDSLCRTIAPEQYSIGADYVIRAHFEHEISVENALALLPRLDEVLRREPHGEHSHISRRFAWMSAFVPALILKCLSASELRTSAEQVVAKSMALLDEIAESAAAMGHLHLDKSVKDRMNTGLASHTRVKARYFILLAAHAVAKYGEVHPWEIRNLSYRSVVEFNSRDVDWLVAMAVSGEHPIWSRLLLTAAAEWLWQEPTWRRRLVLLSRVLRGAGQPKEVAIAWHAIAFPVQARVTRWWYQNIANGVLREHWRDHQRYRLKQAWGFIRDWLILHRRSRLLVQAKRIDWLSRLAREAGTESTQWAAIDWNLLARKRGRLIAAAVREGCETFWRRYTPQLPHEKPVRNETSFKVVIGLVCLESLFVRRAIDFAALDPQEAEIACRYACNELNGFPDWMGALVEAQSAVCSKVFAAAIAGEWQAPADDQQPGDVTSRLRYAEMQVRGFARETVRDGLSHQDPVNSHMLEHVLHLADRFALFNVKEWAHLAEARLTLYPTNTDHFLLWLSVWLQTDLDAAIPRLEARLATLSMQEQDEVVARMLSTISVQVRRGTSAPRLQVVSAWTPVELERLIALVCQHVRPIDDLKRHAGAYSPTPRDDAQHARSELISRLAQHADPAALRSIERLLKLPDLAPHRDWLLNLFDSMGPRHADGVPFTPDRLHELYQAHVIEPRTDRELFSVALHRLSDIKILLEESENSPRHEAHKDWKEHEFQFWLKRKLEERSRGHYMIVAEEETDDGRADLRFLHSPSNSVVPVEMKWAEAWTYAQLLDALTNQLVGQYLRPRDRRYGVFVVGYIGKKMTWVSPDKQNNWTFADVIAQLQLEADRLVGGLPGVEGLDVISLDFTHN